jgi:hypothetical protein
MFSVSICIFTGKGVDNLIIFNRDTGKENGLVQTYSNLQCDYAAHPLDRPQTIAIFQPDKLTLPQINHRPR